MAIWASHGDAFSTKETFSEVTKFVKQTEQNELYSQGAEWRKVSVTLDRKLYQPITIQGRTMGELQYAALQRLGLTSDGKLIPKKK